LSFCCDVKWDFYRHFLARFENWKNQNGTFPKKAEKMPVFDTFLHFFALFYTFSHFFAPTGPFQKFADPFLKFLNSFFYSIWAKKISVGEQNLCFPEIKNLTS